MFLKNVCAIDQRKVMIKNACMTVHFYNQCIHMDYIVYVTLFFHLVVFDGPEPPTMIIISDKRPANGTKPKEIDEQSHAKGKMWPVSLRGNG